MGESPPRRAKRAAGAAPDAGRLQERALAHLSRYAATEAGLRRVLHRFIDRWLRLAEEAGVDGARQAASSAREAAGLVVARLAEGGTVNDAAFAESRARRLQKSGRSRRAVAAHLTAKGVSAETVRAVLPDAGAEEGADELAAALAFARRRRIGPFRRSAEPPDAEAAFRELGMLARAGFPQDVARAALVMERAAAEAAVIALRRS